MCYIVKPNDETALVGVATLSDDIVHSFHSKKQYIAHGEAFALLLTLWREDRDCKDHR